MALYWAHPWTFPSLDKKGRAYVADRLHTQLPRLVVDGRGYVDLIDQLNDLFGRDDCPVHSFPEMCAEAWLWSAKHGEEPVPPPPHDPGPQTSDADKLAEPRTATRASRPSPDGEGSEESLGKQFRLGHSYVTPTERLVGGARGTREWFEQVAKTEIRPQLDEYWFDSPKTAEARFSRRS